ncbi:MAG: NgoFVII family restriction endonuclease [Balneolaceae bacterium]
MLIRENLFQETLIKPVNDGLTNLRIVSGYASSLMLIRHLTFLKEKKLLNRDLSISLIIGMTSKDGIDFFNHKGFVEYLNTHNDLAISIRYVNDRPPVHSKLYLWNNNNSNVSFIGSANYSQNAFSESTREVLLKTNQAYNEANDYYESILENTIDCRDLDENNDSIRLYRRESIKNLIEPESDEFQYNEAIGGLEKVTLSLLDRSGRMPERSGLNWGQRPSRDRNQAYLGVPVAIQRTNFFPVIAKHFLVITDDGKELVCVRAQQNGKAIHTTFSNSYMGEYFRNRLGLSNGAYVNKTDLLAYGRTDVDIYKIDEETYFLDYSVQD